MNGQPLPNFLEDLAFTLDGQSYQCFPVVDEPGWLQLGLEYERYHSSGIRVNFEKEQVEVKSSCDLKRYDSGHSIKHTQWDDSSPDWYEAGPFEEWLRAEILRDIHRLLSWHLERLFRECTLAKEPERFAQFCADLANHPFAERENFGFSHYKNKGVIFAALAASHRNAQSTELSPVDQQCFENLIAFVKELDFQGHKDAQPVFKIIISMNNPIPTVILEYYRTFILPTFGYVDDEPLDINDLQHIERWLRSMSKNERSIHHPILLRLSQDTRTCHMLMTTFNDYPEEALPYVIQGLQYTPEDISFLTAAQSLLMTLEEHEMISNIQQRIEAMGCRSSGDDVQDDINRYTALCNDFRTFNPSTDADVTAPELLVLEDKLNQHWWTMLPPQNHLSRSVVETQLIEQQRFLSAGSASVFGWMRNQKRYQDVVDLMMSMLDNLELCRLRHRSNPRGFESILNNGLSCFLDSQEDEHIEQAVVFMDALSTLNLEYVSSDPYYAFACISARSRQTQRAIDNV